jgi:putative transposase
MRQTDHEPLKPNTVYHIFSHAVDRNDLFYDEENYKFFLRRWEHFSNLHFHTYAYCLMPNHFHMCVQTLPLVPQLASSFKLDASSSKHKHSKLINNLLSSFTQALNKQRDRKGALFRERFGRIEVSNIDYFKDLICYIHHNPIHHFDASSYSEWAFSSYNYFMFNDQKTFINTEAILNRFGGKEGFDIYHQDYKAKKKYTTIEEKVQKFYTI